MNKFSHIPFLSTRRFYEILKDDYYNVVGERRKDSPTTEIPFVDANRSMERLNPQK